MKTIIILFLVSLFAITNIVAVPVSKEEAQEVALSWYKHIAPPSMNSFSVSNVYIADHKGLITFYVFAFKSGGFVIVAADDASIPILGYSVENLFPTDISCSAVKEWLDNYSLQIKQIVKEGLSNQKTKAIWKAMLNGNFPKPTKDVNPLLTTTWWQGCYYNELCPDEPQATAYCYHAVTGCVATSMAQIMKYHNFPPQGVGSHSYPHPVYGVQSVDFGNTAYDWAAMPDNVTEENLPVATIMYHSGVAVNMKYGYPGSPYMDGSGSIFEIVPCALVDYFTYDPGIELLYQSDFPDTDEWKYILRNDLDNQLPINYGSLEHSFVCDGYSMSDETFHFNWGWGGNYDGYYTIDELNPAGLNFNHRNIAIVHIQPYNPDHITRIIQPENNTVTSTGNPVNIEAATIIGNPDQMKIMINETTVATSNSNTITYIWNTPIDDTGPYEVSVCSYSGNDSVFHRIIINVADWTAQSSGFQTPLRAINYMSAVDSNVVWAVARDGLDENLGWDFPIQEFTYTTDGGETWNAGTIQNCEGLGLAMIDGINEQKAYVAMYRWTGNNPQGIYVTTDGGNTWEHQPSATFNSGYSFTDCVHFFNENDGWCMGDPTPAAGGFEMYTTNNGGATWVSVPEGNMPGALFGEYGMTGGYSAINDTIWFGTTKGRVFRSSDKGYNWSVFEVPDMEGEWIIPVFRNGSHGLIHNFFFYGDVLNNYYYYSIPAAICETFDGGETWASVTYSGPMYWTDIAYVPGTENTWVSTGGRQFLNNGASYSIDGGHTWTDLAGTNGVNLRNMTWMNDHCGWAGGYNMNDTIGGIFKFIGDFSDIVTSVSFGSKVILSHVNIYPNPFSLHTTIEYTLQHPSTVQLIIYHPLGKQIELIQQKQSSGKQQIVWNAKGLPAGVYYFRLQADGQVATGELVLVR